MASLFALLTSFAVRMAMAEEEAASVQSQFPAGRELMSSQVVARTYDSCGQQHGGARGTSLLSKAEEAELIPIKACGLLPREGAQSSTAPAFVGDER